MARELHSLASEGKKNVEPHEEGLMLSGDREVLDVIEAQKMSSADGLALKDEDHGLLDSVNMRESPENEEEDVEDYKEGGYHPCQIGDTLKDGRYLVTRKLGWGYFSTVWLAQDKHNNDTYVALKVVRAAQNYMETALDEIELLKRISSADENHAGRQYVVTLHDHFIHVGPNGAHVCMVFEVLGENLLSLMKRFNYKGLPPKLVKQIAKQVLLGLDYLHRKCGVIHTDIKPENVLIRIYDVERVVREVDELQRQQEERKRNLRESESRVRAKSELEALQHDFKERQSKQLFKSYRSVADEVSRNVASVSPIKAQDAGFSGTSQDETRSSVPDVSEAKPAQQSRTATVALPARGNRKKSIVTGSQPLPSPLKWPKSKSRHHSTGPSASLLASQQSIGSAASVASNVSASSNSSITSAGSVDYSPEAQIPSTLNLDQDSSGSDEKLVHGFTALEDERVTVKIADFGNACWIDHHFTNDIQTRQYRAPEILLGNEWGASVDCWSVACMVFELLTGDYLFEPQSSQTYSKDEDHLAQIIELLGQLPESMLDTGRYVSCFFNSDGSLRNIKKLKEWVLFDVFVEKYGYSRDEVKELCELLLPLLATSPKRRADCGSMLAARWLDDTDGLEGISSDRLPHPNGGDIQGWACESESDNNGPYALSEKNVRNTLKEMVQLSRQRQQQFGDYYVSLERNSSPRLPDPSNLHLSSNSNTFV